jgi:hypothetical protein
MSKSTIFQTIYFLILGMYKVQLNGYAMIFEKLGMGKIGGLGLCYYEPHGDAPTVSSQFRLFSTGNFSAQNFLVFLSIRLENSKQGNISSL